MTKVGSYMASAVIAVIAQGYHAVAHQTAPVPRSSLLEGWRMGMGMYMCSLSVQMFV